MLLDNGPSSSAAREFLYAAQAYHRVMIAPTSMGMSMSMTGAASDLFDLVSSKSPALGRDGK